MTTKITPDWISAEAMRTWCNIETSTEHVWRKRYNLHISKMGDKVYYDKNQIKSIMTQYSTYNLIKKTA